MQNKYFKYLLIILIVAFVIPQITLAVWWNPFSWNIWNSLFNRQAPVTEQVQKNENSDNKPTNQTADKYAKQLSATTYEANVNFTIPVKASDLNSDNIKFCIQNASAVAGADPKNKCENDDSWQFKFSYNSESQVLNIKASNITSIDRERDYGPFNIGCAACTEGLNLTNIHDINGNILPNLTVYVHKDYNK
jgi:hypothetical protein